MVEPQSEPVFPVGFDDDSLEEDLAHLPASAEVALRSFSKELRRQGGIPRSRLMACQAEARDGTRLPGCVKTYIPWPDWSLRRCVRRRHAPEPPAGLADDRIRHPPPPARIDGADGLRGRPSTPATKLVFMSANDSARVAAELLLAHRPAIARGVGGVDECILFTRIAVDVCRERGIRAKALPVAVEIKPTADAETLILLGFQGQRPPAAPDDFWDGHLVAILDGRLLVDLSIDSIARPELGVAPEPFVAEVSPEFISGGSVDLMVPGGVARYRAQPERKDYRGLPAWEKATQGEITRLADALLWPAGHGP